MTDDLLPVDVLGLPVDIHRRAAEHQATLDRELALVAAAQDPSSAPQRLRALSEELTHRYSTLSTQQTADLEAALERGDATVDLHYRLPASAADAAERLDAALDEVDAFCRAGKLLTLITPPEAVAYRRWYLGEFVRQLRDHEPPSRWSPPVRVDDPAAPPAPASATGLEERFAVSGDLDMALAADLRADLVSRIDGGAVHLVMDLTGCEFVDSAGLSLLLTTRARCLDRGGSFRVVGVGPAVRRAMEVAEVYALLVDPAGS